jgi:hypothetical protein
MRIQGLPRLPRLLAQSLLLACALISSTALAQPTDVAGSPVLPRQFKDSGSFTGGVVSENTVLSSIRFGKIDDATRMVLDFDQQSPSGLRAGASAHPVYSITYYEFPYRLIVKLEGTTFAADAYIKSKPALPFTIVTPPDGRIKEMQIYLPWPAEFKVIEVDDPAKLAIDVRRRAVVSIPEVFAVQVGGSLTPEQAFALVERGGFPEGYQPVVLVLGDSVVVEQVFTDPAQAAEVEASLRDMGYSPMINERKGNELPLT